MQVLAEGRVGVVGGISGFVVQEDESLHARTQRDLVQRRDAFVAKAREIKTQALTLPDDAPVSPSKRVLRFTLKAGMQISRGFARVSMPERLKDGLALGALLFHLWAHRPGAVLLSKTRFYRLKQASLMVFISLTALSAALFLTDSADLPPDPVPVPHVAETAAAVLASVQPVSAAQASSVEQSSSVEQASGVEQAQPRPATPQISLSPVEDAPWLAIKRPMPMFNLEAPEVETGDLTYRVFTRGADARQDHLIFTPQPGKDLKAIRPSIHLTLERFEKQRPTTRPLFSDLAMRAAEQKLSLERMSAPVEVQTKFGGMEVAETMMAASTGQQNCLAFRRVDMLGFTLAGWYCGTAAKPVDRVALECFINRLDLVSAGQDQPLKRLFAEAERNRRACASAKQGGRKITWMDHEAPLPPLKRTIASVR